jgi:hypothetical protein
MPTDYRLTAVTSLAILICGGTCCFSQQTTAKHSPLISDEDARPNLREATARRDTAGSKNENIPPSIDLANAPDDVKAAYYAAVKAEYENDAWALRHSQRVYESQFWASIAVFLVSIGIVVVGLYMSWLQFYAYYRQQLHAPPAQAQLKSVAKTTVLTPSGDSAKTMVPPTPPTDTAATGSVSQALPEGNASGASELTKQSTQSELEINPSGVKITTPIIGIVILTLSLVFFYMYLHFVFPIHAS